MVQEWNNLAIEEKLNEAKEFIEKVKDRIAQNPDSCYWAYKTIVCSAIENFFNFLFITDDNNINWENPGIDLHYDVNIDENLNRVDFIVDENDLKDEETFNKKLAYIFVYIHNTFLFDALAKDTVAFKRGESYKYLIGSQEILNKVERIYNRYEKSKKIIELTHYKLDIPFQLNKLNDEKTIIQALSGKLTVQFTPIIVDTKEHTGHYSIIVSLSCDQNLNNYCVGEKREILHIIRESIRKQTLYEGKTPESDEIPETKENPDKEFSDTPENYIEMGFTGKLLLDKSLKHNFIGGNTLQISANKLPMTQKPQKKLTFNKPAAKLSEQEEKFLILYAKEGVKNYAKIAEKMFCSEQTVKNCAQSVQHKLRANNMPQAIYLYFAANNEDLE